MPFLLMSSNMSERIIEALMQLFAIFARPDSDAEDRRPVVQTFLLHQLNKELVEKYLLIFDKEYAEVQADVNKIKNREKVEEQEKMNKIISKLSTRILKICYSVNEELKQEQKMFVLVRILEFVKQEKNITTQEYNYLETLSDALNIEKDEFDSLKNYVISDFDKIEVTDSLLVISNNESFDSSIAKHIYSETFTGEIKVFNVPSVKLQMFRSNGIAELNLNGQLIPEDTVQFLTPGSAIRHPKIKPIYFSEILSAYNVDKTKSRIVFETKDLLYRFKGGKIGLHRMNFTEESGNLVGIMGASGAGKSTLLNVLNGTYIPTEGQVCINGIDIHSDKDGILKGLIGHVSQDDLLIEELTVYQNLYYNAKLCFDNYSEEELEETVNDVLKSLGLYEIREMVVGNPLNKKISGGQRKRLNIALELIREPAILFLDEPTSGLSSRDSENIMDLLKELSLKGKLVFVVIHQPSSDIFKTFDKLVILDTGGYLIYYGDPVDSIIYFKEKIHQADWNESECRTCGNVNPEQIFKIIEANVVNEYGNITPKRKLKPKEWYDIYNDGNEGKEDESGSAFQLPEISFKIPNWFRQFKVFATRDILSKFTNKQYVLINALEAPIIAVFLSYIIKYTNVDVGNELGYTLIDNNNLPVYIFMLVICAIFIGLTVSAEEIIADRRILKRESFLNLSRSSYLMSKVAILFMISAVQAALFVVLGNTILEIKGMYFHYWLVAFSTWVFANILGLNISDSLGSAKAIYILIPFLVIPQIILSGIIVSFDKLNPSISDPETVPIYGEVMTSRWAYEALAVYQFTNNDYMIHLYPYNKVMSQSDYKKTFWLTKLKNKINFCERNIGKPEKKEEVVASLELLRNEINKELKENPKYKYNLVSSLYYDKLSPAVIHQTKHYFKILKTYYVKRYNNANKYRDELVAGFQKTTEDREKFIMTKKMHHNENLADFAKNSNSAEKIIEYENQLIQKIDPIYQDPRRPFLKAHFYAPRKAVFGSLVDTYWVNVMVIWVMTISLYILLYFRGLKRFLDFTSFVSERLVKKED